MLFEEHQSFRRQPWLWAIMLIAFVCLAFALVIVEEGRDVLGWIMLVYAVGFLLILSLNMTVRVDADAVAIRFFPIWSKRIPVQSVVRWEACTYRPIRDYGGWGIRYAFRKGWAYNVHGARGVQLELSDGKRVLIGSQRPEELALAIEEAKRSSNSAWVRPPV